MSVRISFANIEKMLKECAPGCTIRLATHSRVVTFGNLVFRTLPKYDEIDINYIRKLVRSLEIDRECAERHLQQLKKH